MIIKPELLAYWREDHGWNDQQIKEFCKEEGHILPKTWRENLKPRALCPKSKWYSFRATLPNSKLIDQYGNKSKLINHAVKQFRLKDEGERKQEEEIKFKTKQEGDFEI